MSIINIKIVIFIILLTSRVIADDLIKVGFILPLTSKWSEFGEAQRNGIELAKENNPDLLY